MSSEILIIDDKMSLNPNTNFEWLGDDLHSGNQFAWEFARKLGFKEKIGKDGGTSRIKI